MSRPPAKRPARETRRLDVHIPASTIVRVVIAIVVVAIAVKLWLAFLIFIVAVLLALTLDPAVRRLERRGLERPTAVIVVALAVLCVVGAGVVVIVPPLASEIGVLVRDFEGTRERIQRDFPPDSPLLNALLSQVLALPDAPEVREWFARPLVWGRIAVEILAGVVVVLMLAFYLLVDGKRTYTWLLSYVPRRHRRRVAETAPAVTEVVRSYVRGQFITSVLCGVYAFVVLSILGVPAALPLSLAAAILDVLPILGTIAMTVPATLLALTVSPFAAGVVLVAYLLYHLAEVYFIAPRVYGRNLRLSTLSVMLALLVGGLLQGILGAVLVLPLVAAYPIVERIWLSKYLGTDVVTDHTALAASVGTERERAVEKTVIRGEPHVDVPLPATPGAADEDGAPSLDLDPSAPASP